jgi:PmbA protein
MSDKAKVLENLMESVSKKLEAFCDQWSIKGIVKEENQIRFSNNEVDINKHWDEIKLNLFLSQKRRTMDITINDLRAPLIEKTLKECEEKFRVCKMNVNFKSLPEKPSTDFAKVNIYDDKVRNLGEKAIDLVHLASEAALQEGASRVAGSFFYGTSSFIIKNNIGNTHRFKRTGLNFRIRAFAHDLYSTGEGISCSTHLNHGFNAQEAGIEAGSTCKMAMGAKKGTPGLYNIIIYPKVATELQAPTAAIAMNSYVQKMGLAWLVGKREGDVIASEQVSVWDDGTMDYGMESAPCDEELVPTKRTLLIDNGRIKQFFTNNSLSKKGNISTANAGITVPKPTNTVFSTGSYSLEELMEITEQPTLLITSTWYTRYQSYAPPGAFSSLPKDGMFLVKNKGKTLESIKELRINSNHFQMLQNILALGKNAKQVMTWLSTSNNPVFAPLMLIKDIQMSTATK